MNNLVKSFGVNGLIDWRRELHWGSSLGLGERTDNSLTYTLTITSVAAHYHHYFQGESDG